MPHASHRGMGRFRTTSGTADASWRVNCIETPAGNTAAEPGQDLRQPPPAIPVIRPLPHHRVSAAVLFHAHYTCAVPGSRFAVRPKNRRRSMRMSAFLLAMLIPATAGAQYYQTDFP